MKVNKLDKMIPDATTLIHINQYNTDKQNLGKNVGDINKKYQTLVDWKLPLFLTQKLVKLRIKFLLLVPYSRK